MDQRARKLSRALKISIEEARELVEQGLTTPGKVRRQQELEAQEKKK
jgi:hypothetical protein